MPALANLTSFPVLDPGVQCPAARLDVRKLSTGRRAGDLRHLQIVRRAGEGRHSVRLVILSVCCIYRWPLDSRESKWSKPSSGIKIVPIITSKETFTPGDAMRDIYTHGIITTDFVLVTGDLVSNVKIDEVVRVHKERRRKNKDAIMTIVVKPSGGVHRTKCVAMLSAPHRLQKLTEKTREGRRATRVCSYWTHTLRNVSITRLLWDTHTQSTFQCLAKFWKNTPRSRFAMI